MKCTGDRKSTKEINIYEDYIEIPSSCWSLNKHSSMLRSLCLKLKSLLPSLHTDTRPTHFHDAL